MPWRRPPLKSNLSTVADSSYTETQKAEDDEPTLQLHTEEDLRRSEPGEPFWRLTRHQSSDRIQIEQKCNRRSIFYYRKSQTHHCLSSLASPPLRWSLPPSKYVCGDPDLRNWPRANLLESWYIREGVKGVEEAKIKTREGEENPPATTRCHYRRKE